MRRVGLIDVGSVTGSTSDEKTKPAAGKEEEKPKKRKKGVVGEDGDEIS